METEQEKYYREQNEKHQVQADNSRLFMKILKWGLIAVIAFPILMMLLPRN